MKKISPLKFFSLELFLISRFTCPSFVIHKHGKSCKIEERYKLEHTSTILWHLVEILNQILKR